MSPKQLATKILQYRSSASLIVPGTLYADIGPENMKEALDRRWLEADQDSGFLCLSSMQAKIEEMRLLAEGKCDKCSCDPCECCDTCGKHPCTCQKAEALDPRKLAEAHTKRQVYEYTVPPGYGSGQGEKPMGVQPVTPDRSPASNITDYAIGEDVIVMDPKGEPVQAKVAERDPKTGTYKLTFGGQTTEQRYRPEQIQRPKKASGQPGDVNVTR